MMLASATDNVNLQHGHQSALIWDFAQLRIWAGTLLLMMTIIIHAHIVMLVGAAGKA